MKILITIDVELSWGKHKTSPALLQENIDSAYYGGIGGQWGLLDQLRLLNKYGFKAVCFVEALSSQIVGGEQLRRICDEIQNLGHEVQLHLHPEWLLHSDQPALRALGTWTMAALTVDDQARVMEIGLNALHRAGVVKVSAHRAGAFCANLDTLRAARAVGLQFESSYNATYVGTRCKIELDSVQIAPTQLEGIWSFPVTNFLTSAGSYRHMQISAAAKLEVAAGLRALKSVGADCATLVSHSFELVSRDRTRPNPLLVWRMHNILDLIANDPSLTVVGFNDFDTSQIDPTVWDRKLPPIGRFPTLVRYAEQAISRLYE